MKIKDLLDVLTGVIPAGMGTISLALVPNNLPATDVATAKANIKLAADKFISIENSQGYGVPIEEKPLDRYFDWFPMGI